LQVLIVNCYRIPKTILFRELFYSYIKSVTEFNMSAARRQNDVLQMFYNEIPAQVNRRLPHPPLNPHKIEDVFFTSKNNFSEWLRVWK